ncbi:hypothetical protein SDC9_21274 [bioreactor metagenome]|uniref:DUF2117 domain-containing protein n=1 Tax=bioreactor metagenome TaxID=1076179 RepID=A0A644U940_9ZZZZ|nr:DUF2117 domain-containing protein [Methanobrevibacter sp.]MEA4957628.1 DUF2117 domain-containing protein [Methanobrevibacter sp.]
MKIGIVVHGPNIIDSGCALKIIEILKSFGEVYCRLGGTMGRTAVIDASLENLIDISTKRLPSESVRLFLEEGMDVIFLINYGKSSVTGHTFGYKVFKKAFNPGIGNLDENTLNKKFIQIERPGEDDGSIILWNGSNDDLHLKISKLLNLNVLDSQLVIEEYMKRELKTDIKNNLINNLKDNQDNNPDDDPSNNENNDQNNNLNNCYGLGDEVRYIHGVSPNENIFVNGVVIGKSNSENLSLVSKDGKIVDIIGGEIKKHGIEKLGVVDINNAVVKTGLLRKTNPNPRIIKDSKDININRSENNRIKVAFLDHAAEDIYSLKNVDIVVTIGDDTTLVASDILYRFNIPVIGITDGDVDKVVQKGYVTEGSTIIELKPGQDDIVGKYIFQNVFKSKNYIKLEFSSTKTSNNDFKDKLKSNRIKEFKNEIFEIINEISPEYNIKFPLNND